MRTLSLFQSAMRWLVLATFLSGLGGLGGLAIAQQEPTMNQIYAAAQSGKLDEAQVMVQQVLIAHPKSAKAHFVQSELFARQGNVGKAREALSTAQSLAPGLPFAKPEAVAALEKQLVAKPVAASVNPGNSLNTAAATHSSGSWMLPALLAAGVIAAAYFIFRRKPAQTFEPAGAYGNGMGSGLSGPQTFGNGGMQPNMQGGYGPQPMYGQPGYGQPGYGQPAGSGMGGRIMGGVATGLAVGAGVMAAEAIGRNLMGNHDSAAHAADNTGTSNFEPVGNADMGGNNFGISDTGWDDAGASDAGGGGDWDN